jgi:hypothetical protein
MPDHLSINLWRYGAHQQEKSRHTFFAKLSRNGSRSSTANSLLIGFC